MQSSSPVDKFYRVDNAAYDSCPISVLTGQSVNINGIGNVVNPASEILHLEEQIGKFCLFYFVVVVILFTYVLIKEAFGLFFFVCF